MTFQIGNKMAAGRFGARDTRELTQAHPPKEGGQEIRDLRVPKFLRAFVEKAFGNMEEEESFSSMSTDEYLEGRRRR